MKPIAPLSIDFSTLNTFIMVYELRSFSAAASKLQCNQSSISYAIDRMRKVFNDALFIRQGNSITPTLRCDELAVSLKTILKNYQQLIAEDDFEPSKAHANITFSCSHYEQSVFLSRFIKRLGLKAPGIKVKVIHSGISGLTKLKQADCEFLLSPMQLDAGDLHQKTLWNDHYVCAMDRSHILGNQQLTLKDLAQASYVAVTYDGYWQPFYQQKLNELGIALNASIELPSLSSLEVTLLDSPYISLVAAKFASSFGPNIKTLEAPVSVSFDNYLYWGARTHNDPMHPWLRHEISEFARELFSSEAG